MNATNNSIAGAAVLSPVWLPSLSDISTLAAELLPIAGLFYLVIQIIFFVRRKKGE